MDLDTDYLTAEQAAQLLGRSVATVYRLARRRRVRRARLLGRVLFVRVDVESLASEINAQHGEVQP